MPRIKAAVKALRQSEKHRSINRAEKDLLKKTIKEFVRAAKDKKGDLNEKLSHAYQVIDKAAKHNIIHRNNAARKKSLLARRAAAAK